MDEAASELGKAIELAPQDAFAHDYLAKVLSAQSKSADALQELRKAAVLKPDWFELQMELGLACQRAADADCAVAAFGEAWSSCVFPRDAEAYNDLGLALICRKGDVLS